MFICSSSRSVNRILPATAFRSSAMSPADFAPSFVPAGFGYLTAPSLACTASALTLFLLPDPLIRMYSRILRSSSPLMASDMSLPWNRLSSPLVDLWLTPLPPASIKKESFHVDQARLTPSAGTDVEASSLGCFPPGIFIYLMRRGAALLALLPLLRASEARSSIAFAGSTFPRSFPRFPATSAAKSPLGEHHPQHLCSSTLFSPHPAGYLQEQPFSRISADEAFRGLQARVVAELLEPSAGLWRSLAAHPPSAEPLQVTRGSLLSTASGQF